MAQKKVDVDGVQLVLSIPSRLLYVLALSIGFGGNPLLALNVLTVAKAICPKEDNHYGKARESK